MTTSLKMIKHLTVLSVAFLLLTYIVFINMEMRLISLQSVWISNNLLFTLFSSVLASTLVVLLGEIRQYQLLKRAAQDRLFCHLANLYGQLLNMRYSMKRLMEDTSQIVSENLLDQPASICRQKIELIRNISYTTFCSKDNVLQTLQSFRKEQDSINNFLIECVFLKQAIYRDRLNHLKNNSTQECITAQSPCTNHVLVKLSEMIMPLLEKTDKYLEDIDNKLSNRYNWTFERTTLVQYQENYKEISLDDFLKEGNA